MGSNGSVIPFFLKEKKKGVLPITDPTMTRFNILLSEGVEMVINALKNAWGGEIFVPKIPSYRITDVANAIDEKCDQKIIGIRPGEKIHEEMITSSDSFTTYDLGKFYVILPQQPVWDLEKYIEVHNGEKVPENFRYNSEQNDNFLTVSELRKLINENVNPPK